MSEMKFTPGPWKASRKSVFVSDLRDMTVATISDRGEAIANAKLIAAAPELLEAVKKCLEIVETGDLPNWDWVRSIVAKAEGRQP